MSTPASPNTQQPPPAQKMQCPKCGGDMFVAPASFRFTNFAEVSLMIVTHATPEKCPNCGARYVMRLAGFNENGGLNLAYAELVDKQSAIVAPTNENMQSALAARQISEAAKGQ